MYRAIKSGMMRYKGSNTSPFNCPCFRIENVEWVAVNGTYFLFRSEKKHRYFIKELNRYVLRVYLSLIIMDKFNYIGIFFKSCSLNNIVIASGDAFTSLFSTALDNSATDASGCLMYSTRTYTAAWAFTDSDSFAVNN